MLTMTPDALIDRRGRKRILGFGIHYVFQYEKCGYNNTFHHHIYQGSMIHGLGLTVSAHSFLAHLCIYRKTKKKP